MTDTLREKAMSPEEVEFARLVSLGMDEAKANEQWLSGTASIKLTPFARDGLAHSFGLLLDRIEKLEGALRPFVRMLDASEAHARKHKTSDPDRVPDEQIAFQFSGGDAGTITVGDFRAAREALRSEKP